MKHDPHDIIRRPLITEKGTDMTTERNGYTFLVAPHANKVQIRKAVEALFDVDVTGVNTMVRKGKSKGRGPRAYARADWKRAIVTLAEGQAIEFL